MPTLLELETPDEHVELCVHLGLSFVEWNMDVPGFRPEQLPAERLRQWAKKEIFFTLHLPEEVNLATPHHAVLRGYLEECKEVIRWAGEAGIRLVNLHLHPGVAMTLPDRKKWVHAKDEEGFARLFVSSVRQLLALGRESGVTVCFENIGNFHLPFVLKSLDCLYRSGMEGWGLTWDTGHDAKCGFREEPVFRRFAGRVAHLHLHDFDGKTDHLPLWSGQVPLEDRLAFVHCRELTAVVWKR
jgi:sugar phosphate isomerase/epimerase